MKLQDEDEARLEANRSVAQMDSMPPPAPMTSAASPAASVSQGGPWARFCMESSKANSCSQDVIPDERCALTFEDPATRQSMTGGRGKGRGKGARKGRNSHEEGASGKRCSDTLLGDGSEDELLSKQPRWSKGRKGGNGSKGGKGSNGSRRGHGSDTHMDEGEGLLTSDAGGMVVEMSASMPSRAHSGPSAMTIEATAQTSETGSKWASFGVPSAHSGSRIASVHTGTMLASRSADMHPVISAGAGDRVGAPLAVPPASPAVGSKWVRFGEPQLDGGIGGTMMGTCADRIPGAAVGLPAAAATVPTSPAVGSTWARFLS